MFVATTSTGPHQSGNSRGLSPQCFAWSGLPLSVGTFMWRARDGRSGHGLIRPVSVGRSVGRSLFIVDETSGTT